MLEACSHVNVTEEDLNMLYLVRCGSCSHVNVTEEDLNMLYLVRGGYCSHVNVTEGDLNIIRSHNWDLEDIIK